MNYFKQLQKKKPDDEEEEKKVEEDDEEEEKKEKKEEKKEDKDSVAEEKKGRNIPPLITTSTRKRPVMNRERWMEMAQIRRWDVKITNISVENLYKEPYDPFLEFVVGGNFKIIQKPGKKGKLENVYTGTLGYTSKTEVLKNLLSKEMKMMETRVHCEYLGSYFDIQEQYLRVDIWDWEKWNLNEFLGRIEIPLIEVIQGDVEQSFLIMKAGEKKKIKLCRINFTISFQEIWDFMLTFSDWSGNGLIDEKGGSDINPSLEMSLQSQGHFRTKVRTNMVENESNPQWPTIKGNIIFRGTINELQNQRLSICLYDGSLFSTRKIGEKVTDLLGIIDSGIISTDLVQKHKKRGGHSCSIKGRINIQKTPRYRQTGEIILLNSEGQYLCVSVMRVDNVVLAHDKGAVNTFIELDWGGYLKRTRTAFRTYKPIFNDTFYFPITISEGLLGNSETERTKAIMEELQLYSCINFNFWSIDEEMSNDSLGSATFFLSELQNSRVQEKEFFDEKTESSQIMKIRVWSGKKQLASPFISSGEISNLFIDVWLLYENEKKIDYEDLPKEKPENLPDNFEELLENWTSTDRFMKESFPEETQREFVYEAKDEHDKQRFLPLYLSKLGYPNPSKVLMSSVEDLPIDYLPVETCSENAYFASLIPFSSSQNDIWTSPEFLIHMKKGESDDHGIFLACLLMSVKTEDRLDEDLNTDEEPPISSISSPKFSSKSSPKTQKKRKSKFEVEEDDMEKRVFVCVGSLKQRKTRQVWVMTFNSDHTAVTFWEPSNNSSYILEKRVSSPENLKKFFDKEIVNSQVYKKGGEEIEKPIEKSESDEEIIIMEDDYSDDEEEEEDEVEEDRFKNKNKKLGDARIGKEDLAASDLRFNHKKIGIKVDLKDSLMRPKEKKSFLENKNEEELKNQNNFQSLIQEPKVFKGVPVVEVPYRTIDVIFNNKNIYMNLQHFDPTRILYDIYDKTLWCPFVPDNQKVFGAFYSPPTLHPPLHLPVAKRLHDSIIKEIKISISALRSGKNLGTSWKNQKDRCVEEMENHLKFLEKNARGEFSESKAKMEKRNWGIQMKQFMPTNFRMTAVPSHFNYPEPDRIASIFIENAKDFFLSNYKNMKWALAVRIFPYVGKIISIRILVACFYPVPGGV